MLGIETPLLDQGAIQFMILVVMLVIVAVVIWITIPRSRRPVCRPAP